MVAAALVLAGAIPCAGIAAQTVPVRQGLVPLADGRIFYEVVGTGDPIIVVPGVPGLDHSYLRPGLDVLASSNALVYYDQPGTGRSTSPLDSAHINMASFVADIDTLRLALGYNQVTLLGHSFGGLIAMAYAMAHPDQVKGLILMDTSEPGSQFRDQEARNIEAKRTPADSLELAHLLASPGYAARDPATISEVYKVRLRAMFLDPQRVADLNLKILPETAHNGAEVARMLGADSTGIDWWSRLPTLNVPTLVVQGRADPMPMAMARALVAALPQATLSVLNSGCFPEVEDPQGLVAAVSTFLAQLTR